MLAKLSLLVTVLSMITVASPSTNGTLKGVVTDSEGAAIRRARIYVYWDESGADVGLKSNVGIKNVPAFETNVQGEFSTELPPGFYDVFITATGFTPKCRKVRVKSGEAVSFNPKLSPDSAVIKELGDQF